MTVSIIIINYNSFRMTSDCIRSVIRYTKEISYEIILVDNASAESDPGLFLNEFPGIRLIRSVKNGGFAYGNNLGIAAATGDIILLLNSDTILTEDSISLSARYLMSHPKAGVVSCRMTYPDGRIQYTARRFRSISWELLDLFRFIPMLMPYSTRAKRMLGKYFRHDINIQADWLNGAFFMFPKKILEQLPGNKLDDRFFMYGEDQLWCEQIKNLGYHHLFFADTTIVHINSGSTSLSKQLGLRKIMMKHELEIMRLRKGKGVYYFLFKLIYTGKESTRNLIKAIIFRMTGKLVR
jgi:GT2 family glycosyltransferase